LLANRKRSSATALRIQTEDALKHLFHQEQDNQTTTLSALAAALDIQATSALHTVERMQETGLVTMADGRTLLTEEGRRYALQIIRAHRLWERYLADETGVKPEEWHRRAERHEHRITPDEADNLAERLGNPRFDPHGDPIPTAEGEVPSDLTEALSKLTVGDRAVVVHVEDEPDVVYAQLVASGIHPGSSIRVDARTDERIVLEVDGHEVALAPIVASNVSIRRIEVSEVTLEEVGGTLSQLEAGDVGEVVHISPACRGIERRRIMDLGIVPGTRVAFERNGLTGGLTAFNVRGTVVALRQEQTDMISVNRIEEAS
jgi:DtxR family Mn-dependent transcriptional regulator